MSTSAASVEVVRGELSDELADGVLEFWSQQGALQGDAARQRLPAVVCVAVDEEDNVVGVNSVEERTVVLVGRTFWAYRILLADQSDDDLADAMFNSAFEALAEEFEGGPSGPLGVCVVIEDRETMERRPEAVWPETELFFAGYRPDNRQLRIRYFWGATTEPGDSRSHSADQMAARDLQRDYRPDERFRVEPLAESDSVSADDVIALWKREGVVADAAAERRIDQVHLVAVRDENELVGVSTIYLERSQRIPMDLWTYRTFVTAAHRESSLAAQMFLQNLETLERRFVSGEDTRGKGLLFELQNDQLMRTLNSAVWPLTGTTFIGENPMGAHIRVRYFSGAQVPPPS
jgi:hypothetical protein